MAAANKIIRLKEFARKRVEQRSQAKLELAGHAIDALSELGYARTSMRDIAAQSGRSIGALNYYFEDKSDLITFCVRLYKENFVNQIDEIINSAGTKDALINAFIEGLVDTIAEDAQTHRLWYDIRSQALFDESFHDVSNEIEQALIDMVGRLLVQLGFDSETTTQAYYLLDGSFRKHLQNQLQGDADTATRFRAELQSIFSMLAGG